jgi:hypothetical protein
VGEARSLPKSGAPEMCFTQVGSGLTCKHQTRLDSLARDKHSSLIRKIVNYDRKKFYRIGPCMRPMLMKKHSLVKHIYDNLKTLLERPFIIEGSD